MKLIQSVSSALERRAGNEALALNPTVATIDITTAASDFLWMVFSVMALSTIAIGVWGQIGFKQGERVFHHLAVMLLATASVAYFCMASDLGAVAIPVEFIRGSYPGVDTVTRSIWYARYIDWTITTPLLLLELLLVTGLPLSDIVVIIFFDIVMIITGLIGSLVHSTYKWGLYTMGCAAMLYVFYSLYVPGRKASQSLGGGLAKSYVTGAAMLSFLWFLYPIAWGLADGGNVISPTGEMVFYGVLDLLAKPVFTVVHLYSLRNVDFSVLQLQSGKFSESAGSHAHHGSKSEKLHETNATAANGDHHTTATTTATAAPPITSSTRGVESTGAADPEA